MYTGLPSSSYGSIEGQDHSIDNKVEDMFETAKGRFKVPTRIMPRIWHSMDLVGVSPFSLDSTPDSSGLTAALASDHSYLESKTSEMCDDDEIQSTGVIKEDGEQVMQPSLDDLSASSLPSMPFKVSPCTYIILTAIVNEYLHQTPAGHICVWTSVCVYLCVCPQGY